MSKKVSEINHKLSPESIHSIRTQVRVSELKAPNLFLLEERAQAPVDSVDFSMRLKRNTCKELVLPRLSSQLYLS